MKCSGNFLIQSVLVVGLVGSSIGRLTSNNLHLMIPKNNVSADSEKIFPFANGPSEIYANGTGTTFETKTKSWTAAAPTDHDQHTRILGSNRFSKGIRRTFSEESFVMDELKDTVRKIFTKPSTHPLHKLTAKISHMLHQVGFLGECSVTSPWRLQDMVFKAINYVALGASLDEKKGDGRTMKEHPIRQMVQLFANKFKNKNCAQKFTISPFQNSHIDELLLGLDPAIKDHLWKILRSSVLPLTAKKYKDLREFGPEFFRQLCLKGLQKSEDRNEFCGEAVPFNSTADASGGKKRPKRFAHPDDQVLDKIFRRAGYAHGHYDKPAEPEIVIIEDDDDKKDHDKAIFIPKIILTVGTYILLCLLSLKAFFLSHAGQKGDRGEPGMDGEKGDKGLKGLPGHKGKRGYPGLKGDKGEPGVDGPPGEKGDKGCTGEMGFPGEKGHPGEKGDTGEKGSKGEKGQKGQQGSPGHRGPRGPRGRPAFHSSHRKKRELLEVQSHVPLNLNTENGSLSAELNEQIFEKNIKLTNLSLNRSDADKTIHKMSNGVMGPDLKTHRGGNRQQMDVNSVSVDAETKSFSRNNLDAIPPRVFPVGPDGQTQRKELLKDIGNDRSKMFENNYITSIEQKSGSDYVQQVQSMFIKQKPSNAYEESESVISAMNELWDLYKTSIGCIQCRLFEHLVAQPSVDLDSYIIAGFAHVLGDSGSLQLLDRVRRAKEQKKKLSCVQYDVNKCEVVSF